MAQYLVQIYKSLIICRSTISSYELVIYIVVSLSVYVCFFVAQNSYAHFKQTTFLVLFSWLHGLAIPTRIIAIRSEKFCANKIFQV